MSALGRITQGSHITYFCPTGQVLWEELLKEVILHITPLCSLLHKLLKDKWQVHVFAGRVKFVFSQSSCRTSTIMRYFCPLLSFLIVDICNSYTMACPPVRGDNPQA